MAEVHNTTMAPTKLELLGAWMPRQSWYVGSGSPSLGRAGGFRLDDPAGQVGIELMVVSDSSAEAIVYYLVPMTYRDAPLSGLDGSLIGTSQHGVLGTRWIYDGVADPVLMAQVRALLRGEAQAQAQTVSNTLDSSVHVVPGSGEPILARVLNIDDAAGTGGTEGTGGTDGSVSATWTTTAGTLVRGNFASMA
jgi:hypothetical protein